MLRRWGAELSVEADSLAIGPEFATPLALIVAALAGEAAQSGAGRPDGADAGVTIALRRCSEHHLRLDVACGATGRDAVGQSPDPSDDSRDDASGGVGLLVAKTLAAQLNGRIRVRRREGFVVEIIVPAPGSEP